MPGSRNDALIFIVRVLKFCLKVELPLFLILLGAFAVLHHYALLPGTFAANAFRIAIGAAALPAVLLITFAASALTRALTRK